MLNQRNPLPEFQIRAVAQRHGARKSPGADTRTFSTNLGNSGTDFVVSGFSAGKAAHELADLKSGEVAKFIDDQLAPGERATKFCRLKIAYDLLKRLGYDVD